MDIYFKRNYMKRVIFTRSQINEVMDNEKTQVAFNGSNASEMGTNAQKQYDDAVKAGLNPNNIKMDGRSNTNNASDKDEVQVSFNTNNSNLRDSVTQTVQNAVSNGLDINKLNVVGNPEDINNGTNENYRVISKKKLEEARAKSILEGCRVVSKREISEDVRNATELLPDIDDFSYFNRTGHSDQAERFLANRVIRPTGKIDRNGARSLVENTYIRGLEAIDENVEDVWSVFEPEDIDGAGYLVRGTMVLKIV